MLDVYPRSGSSDGSCEMGQLVRPIEEPMRCPKPITTVPTPNSERPLNRPFLTLQYLSVVEGDKFREAAQLTCTQLASSCRPALDACPLGSSGQFGLSPDSGTAGSKSSPRTLFPSILHIHYQMQICTLILVVERRSLHYLYSLNSLKPCALQPLHL